MSRRECGQRFNEKCLGRIAELKSNNEQTRAKYQKESDKGMYPFSKETFVSKKKKREKK